ncbi:MAG: hypothetical protein JNM85_08160 [Chthonomonas sp.]|nr:hypothetical protein [Chthonomonas sp.]
MASKRNRSKFYTEAISCDVAPPEAATPVETEFEKKRGISRIELRSEFTQIHVSNLAEPVMEWRLNVLEAIASQGVSVDFMKFSPSGVSCLVADRDAPLAERGLTSLGLEFTVHTDRSVVLVHAVNLRDEEGLIARILSVALGAGAPVDHLGDTHDRLLIATTESGAKVIQEALHAANLEVDA